MTRTGESNRRATTACSSCSITRNARRQWIMLTATPINNRLSDFRHMTELFTRRDEAYFARTIGVNNLRAHFNQMEKTLRSRVGQDEADAAEHMSEAQEILFNDAFFRELVVQRSRDYARESQIREYGKAAAFPERRDPHVAAYSIRKTYGRMLDLLEKAFAKQSPLFTLPMYYPLHWYRGPDKDIDPFEENRQRQVIGLIRTNFLKRFESSVAAFELSCDRLLQKLLAFIDVHSESDAEKKRLERWMAQNAGVLGYAVQRQLEFWGEEGDEGGRRRHRPPRDARRGSSTLTRPHTTSRRCCPRPSSTSTRSCSSWTRPGSSSTSTTTSSRSSSACSSQNRWPTRRS